MNESKKNLKYLLDVVLIIIVIISITINLMQYYQKNLRDKVVEISEESENKQVKTISTENWDLEKVNIVYDLEGIPVPVPKGFVGSNVTGENTINTGFVIYEGENEVNDENAWDSQIDRNQFVWIPIYDVNEMYGRDENGIARGKLYAFESTGKIKLEWSENTDNTMRINMSKNYEPKKGNTNTSYIPEYLSEENKAYNYNFESMIESVTKYGGFYIGRYETGFTNLGACVQKMQTNINSKNRNDMENRCKIICNNDNVVTEMIYGCQMDATLQWLYDSGSKTHNEIAVDSTGWGNYYNVSFQYKTSKDTLKTKNINYGFIIPTGSSEYAKANNIYDLAGNVWEWTQEINNSTLYTRRGGARDSYAIYPVSNRHAISNDNGGADYLGCRASLYIAVNN